ncbi:energy-coupling factor transporter transmembrane component T family protein [Mycolicibacterium litorale]|uniref:Cobalt ABC transporter n=1 Tax=Mycolicibacterium litorale TaxID=758802 RepID=A0AAD1IP96_9MYCO|nr:energy-coupling factor transporter transmembrane protein EcfT [Mycolicibacterium litorale]MCV7417498.1 energy-coupling factor transporter transmembrane protein EcfT [Mycolicibacterium litorale]TDY05287.1 biotin transport system permease protein [Mycolicibacterium litorale]BBY18724.1 cobalt ABC transporter [Mycolicibacterium litorale]
MTTLGVYRPGSSLLHRVPAGVKLVGLGGLIALMSILVDTPADLGIAAAGLLVVFAAARMSARDVVTQLRPVFWVVVFIFAFQLLFTDWRRTLVVCGVLLLSVALAAVVTASTRTTDMLAAMTRAMRPLRRIGFPVDQVALALALTIRAIPLMVETVRQVEEARRARGLRFSPRIVVAPVVVAALRTADGFAEALAARGLD